MKHEQILGENEAKKLDREQFMSALNIKREPDAVLILAAGLAERKSNGRTYYSTTSYLDDQANFIDQPDKRHDGQTVRQTEKGLTVVGSGGGKARTLSAIELYDYFHMPILMEGVDKKAFAKISDEPYDETWKDEKRLLMTHNVKENEILIGDASPTTITEIIRAIQVGAKNNWHDIVIITNRYHMPRVEKLYELLTDKKTAATKMKYIFAGLPDNYKAMMKLTVEGTSQDPKLIFADDSFFGAAAKLKINFVPAEDVLSLKSPKYVALFKKAEATEFYKKRLAGEARGIAQLEGGTYGKPRE